MDGSGERQGLRWQKLFAEFVIIVVGVVVGLAVDSAREARSDAARAVEYLQQIRADMSASRDRTEEQIERSRTIAGAAERLLEGLNQPVHPPVDSLRHWWGYLFSLGVYRPSSVAIDALVDGGDLGLIRDPELRRAIMTYREQAEMTETATTIGDDLTSRAVSRIGEDLSLANLSLRPSESRLPLDWQAAAQNPAFQSQVQIIGVMASSTAQQLRLLHAAGTALDSLIADALQ